MGYLFIFFPRLVSCEATRVDEEELVVSSKCFRSIGVVDLFGQGYCIAGVTVNVI